MLHPASRGDRPAFALPCAPALHDESYRRNPPKSSQKPPHLDEHEDLLPRDADGINSLWLTSASVISCQEDASLWPDWTDDVAWGAGLKGGDA